jgi:two-component system, NtrC family, sensor kinase
MPTILIVDDTPEDRKPLAKLLRAKGYNVLTATNAFEAMAAAQREDPDLILLDVMIPPMDGLTFLMLLRDSEIGRQTPVIVITGLDDDNTVSRAHNLRVKEILIKNQFEVPQLLELVEKHIRRKEPPPERQQTQPSAS